MDTVRRHAADDAHVIFGSAYDETLGDKLRVTVIATGLSSEPSQAVAKVEALASSGMDEINIPALLRKQAD